MSELQKLKMWLDTELSINHIYYWVILGVLIGGKFWWLAGAAIVINLIYVFKRTTRLPKDYLSVKGIPRRTK